MKEKIIAFVKKETVLVVAAILAVISAFFVHPDQAYIDYIDFRVLGILLSLMIIMAGVQNNGIFDGIGPVSYTHLDVYKRQKYSWGSGGKACQTGACL